VNVEIYEAMRKANIPNIVACHEETLGYMANGYSRANGGTGFVLVTSGPSVAHLHNPVADAYDDSIPMVVLAGQVHHPRRHTDRSFQNYPVAEAFGATSKEIIIPQIGDDLASIVDEAFYLARDGKPGPVIVDLSADVQTAESSSIHKMHRAESQFPSIADRCEEIFELIMNAKRPLLYVGGGLNHPRGEKILREFTEYTGIPVVNTLHAKGLMREDDPLSLGMLGQYGTPSANYSVLDADLFLAIAVKWDDRVASKVGEFGPRAEIIHINIDANKVNEIRRERNPVFSAITDGAHALEEMLAYAKEKSIQTNVSSWRERVAKLKDEFPLAYNTESDLIQQAEVAEMLNQKVDENTILT